MVKRYGFDQVEELTELEGVGGWCRYEDYLALRNALREALDGCEDWLARTPGAQPEWDRIEFFRAQFLDDK